MTVFQTNQQTNNNIYFIYSYFIDTLNLLTDILNISLDNEYLSYLELKKFERDGDLPNLLGESNFPFNFGNSCLEFFILHVDTVINNL